MKTKYDEQFVMIKNEVNNIVKTKEKENEEIKKEMRVENKQIHEKIIIENQQQMDEINSNVNLESSKLFILINKILINNNSNNPNISKQRYRNEFSDIKDPYEILSYLSKENLKLKRPSKIFESIFIPELETNFCEIILKSNKEEYRNPNKELGISSKTIEMLYSDNTFKINQFMKYFNNYLKIVFEIHRSSSNFVRIIKQIKQNQNDKIQVKVIFDGPKIQKITQNKNVINLIGFDSTINAINENDFSDFTSLSEINIPKSVKILNDSCFTGCSSLKKVKIPTSVTEIFSNAFKDCSSLSDIVIPISIKILNNGCFSGCSSLKEAKIPTSVTEIKDSVFENCKSISKIEIPVTVAKIGARAFSRCSSLSSISIPKSVISIGDNAFELCTSLSTIELPMAITAIGKHSFTKCSSLTHIFIPYSVSSIGEGTFKGCNSLFIIGMPKIFSRFTLKLGIPAEANIIQNKDEFETLRLFARKLEKREDILNNKDEAAKYFKIN